MMRIGLAFPYPLPWDEAIRCVQQVEAHGFDSVWMYENPYMPGAFTTAGAVAAVTSKIRICIGTVSPFLRNPTVIAMEAGQLHRIAPGRVTVGLGATSRDALEAMGASVASPLRGMAAAVSAIRAFWGDGSVNGASPRAFSIDNGLPELCIGATGPRMRELAARHADGLIVSAFAPDEFIAEAVRDVRRIASAAGRADKVRVIALAGLALADSLDDARRAAWPAVQSALRRIGGQPELQRLFAAGGDRLARLVREVATRSGGPVDDTAVELVDRLAIVGSPGGCRQRLAAFDTAGVDELVLMPLHHPPAAELLAPLTRGVQPGTGHVSPRSAEGEEPQCRPRAPMKAP